MSGDKPRYASEENPLSIPRIVEFVKPSNGDAVKDLPDLKEDTDVHVFAISNNGTLGDEYKKDTAGGDLAEGQFSVAAGKITIKAKAGTEQEPGDTKFIIKYNRDVTRNGIQIVNRSDKFPKSVRLTLKVLIVDPLAN